MIPCGSCKGVGVIQNESPFGEPVECFKCRGAGELEMKDLRPGDHCCFLYKNPVDRLSTTVEFLMNGLQRAERCIFIVDELSREEIENTFLLKGIDLKEERYRDSIEILTVGETYLAGGSFEAERMLGFWAEKIEEALSKGFSGIRVVGEAAWALEDPLRIEELIRYETLCNDFFSGKHASVTALCQYNRSRFPSEIIHCVLETHPITILA